MSLSKLSLVSDMPAGDGKITNLCLQCTDLSVNILNSNHKNLTTLSSHIYDHMTPPPTILQKKVGLRPSLTDFEDDHSTIIRNRRDNWRRNILKGQCLEMNNFFEGLKNQISTFCIGADDFNFFASSMYRKELFKFLLASVITLTNYEYFTGSRIRI